MIGKKHMDTKDLIYSKAYKRGKFKLHSGEESTYIFDVLEIIHDQEFLKAFREFVKYENYLVGIGFGGSILAVVSCKPFGIIRKDGTVYGDIPDNYTLIDDVVTTENSLRNAHATLTIRHNFKSSNQFMCAVDRRPYNKRDLHIESMLIH